MFSTLWVEFGKLCCKHRILRKIWMKKHEYVVVFIFVCYLGVHCWQKFNFTLTAGTKMKKITWRFKYKMMVNVDPFVQFDIVMSCNVEYHKFITKTGNFAPLAVSSFRISEKAFNEIFKTHFPISWALTWH